MNNELYEIINYYKSQNAAREQSVLVELLREVQEFMGGVLSESVLDEICKELDIKRNYLAVVMRFIPDLKTEKILHRLTVCGGKNCSSNNSAALHSYIQKTYGVKNGQVSKKGCFSYQTGGCMKHCKEGPCVCLDGKIYTRMTPERFDSLLKRK